MENEKRKYVRPDVEDVELDVFYADNDPGVTETPPISPEKKYIVIEEE